MDKRIKKIAFDLDNTLCDCKIGTPYKDAKPIDEMISILNQLKADGHYIMVYTARGMSKGRTKGQAINMYWQLTYKQLKDWGINFDELLFGKPDFDLLIDDKAVNSKQITKVKDVYHTLKHLGDKGDGKT